MTSDEFRATAIEIFGGRGWVTDLAALVGRDRTTIYRWAHGQHEIDKAVVEVLKLWRHRVRTTGVRPAPRG